MELSDIKLGMAFSEVHALVDSVSVAMTKTGKAYADIVLKSGAATVKCKKWSYNLEKYSDIVAPGKTVKVAGDAQAYQGELQVILAIIEPSDKHPADFARRTQYNVDEIYKKIRDIVDSFEEEIPKYIANKLLIKYKEQFCLSPAAIGFHQAWFGGLIEHTYNMLSIALPIIYFYQSTYKAKFSRDKVLFGIIVHDFGKIFEYDASSPSFKMKPEGILLNHIMRGSILVNELAMEWYYGSDQDDFTIVPKPSSMSKTEFERERDILVHLVVTHHGKKEFGAPQSPACLEAVLIHNIDMLDSHFTPAIDLVQGKPGAIEGFSERCRIEKTQYLQS